MDGEGRGAYQGKRRLGDHPPQQMPGRRPVAFQKSPGLKHKKILNQPCHQPLPKCFRTSFAKLTVNSYLPIL